MGHGRNLTQTVEFRKTGHDKEQHFVRDVGWGHTNTRLHQAKDVRCLPMKD